MQEVLPKILAAATLLPLVSFFIILLAGNKLKSHASTLATLAIGAAAVLSFVGMFGYWLGENWGELEKANNAGHHETTAHTDAGNDQGDQHHHGDDDDHRLWFD